MLPWECLWHSILSCVPALIGFLIPGMRKVMTSKRPLPKTSPTQPARRWVRVALQRTGVYAWFVSYSSSIMYVRPIPHKTHRVCVCASVCLCVCVCNMCLNVLIPFPRIPFLRAVWTGLKACLFTQTLCGPQISIFVSMNLLMRRTESTALRTMQEPDDGLLVCRQARSQERENGNWRGEAPMVTIMVTGVRAIWYPTICQGRGLEISMTAAVFLVRFARRRRGRGWLPEHTLKFCFRRTHSNSALGWMVLLWRTVNCTWCTGLGYFLQMYLLRMRVGLL